MMPLDRKKWVLRGGLYFGFCTALALLFAVETYVTQNSVDSAHPVTWGIALSRSFKTWYVFGVLSLGVIWFSGRNLLTPGRLGRWLAGHVGCLVLFCVADICLSAWLVNGEVSVQTGKPLTFSYMLSHYWAHYSFSDLMIYLFVLLAYTGWHYYRQFKEGEMQACDLERELAEARLQALRMQLNPHFLFNTLHAVSALIHDQPQTADRVLARLSDLLRLSLDTSRAQEIPLREELAFLDSYLEIEQARFSDRLVVRKEIAPDTQNALVPSLILQPLVENAIRHGIEPREEKGEVTIRTRRENDTLVLSVSDNGAGLNGSNSATGRNGVGLSNTRSRLLHLYGSNSKLNLANAGGGGLEACIEMPFHTVSASS
jgi:two-component sensor histidine kinase